MKKKILIVDDAPVMRLILKDIFLSVEGKYEIVGEAANGNEAFDLYQKLKPDLVTMDLIMPDVGGIDAIKKIKAINNEAKIMVVSAIDQRKALMEAIKLGAVDYVIKPFDADRVIASAEEALDED